MMLEGWNPGEKLESFIDRKVRPPQDFKSRMNNAIDILFRHLHGLPGYSVQKVVKTGSLAKGTTTMARADADIVVFFNEYKSIEELILAKPSILRDIKKHLKFKSNPEYIDKIQDIRTTDYHVTFRIHLHDQKSSYHIECDILPAIDILQKCGNIDGVYSEMKTKTPEVRNHYSVCLCKLQLELFRPMPAKVKDLIRLLKYWNKTNEVGLSSYCLEIIGFHVFENYLNSNIRFKMKDGFTSAIELLSSYPAINVANLKYCTRGKFCEIPAPPYVLDPVNPFSNTIKPKIAAWGQETLYFLQQSSL